MTKIIKLTVKQAIFRFPALAEMLSLFVNDDNYVVYYDTINNLIEIGYPEDDFVIAG